MTAGSTFTLARPQMRRGGCLCGVAIAKSLDWRPERILEQLFARCRDSFLAEKLGRLAETSFAGGHVLTGGRGMEVRRTRCPCLSSERLILRKNEASGMHHVDQRLSKRMAMLIGKLYLVYRSA